MKYLPELFSSLAKVDYPREALEIILVDNASSDNSIVWLKENAPYATIIQNSLNYGFAKGNNIGMAEALKNGANYVYLLNQDTIVSPNFIREAVLVAESDASIGAVQSFIHLHPETHLINSSGNKLHFLGFSYCGDYRKSAKEVYERLSNPHFFSPCFAPGEIGQPPLFSPCFAPGEIGGVSARGGSALGGRGGVNSVPIATASGAAAMFKAVVLKEVGLFDEDLYLYHEDVDLSLRVRLGGWRIVCALKSVIYHKYNFSRSITKYYWMERNRIIVWFKILSYPTLALILPGVILAEIGLFLLSFYGGWWREKLRVYSYFWYKNNWRIIFKKHSAIQAARKISDKEIIKSFTDKIEFQEVDSWFVAKIANPLCGIYFRLVKFIIQYL